MSMWSVLLCEFLAVVGPETLFQFEITSFSIDVIIFLSAIMQKSAPESITPSAKKTYLKYTRDMRLELIRLVIEQNLPTAEAARLVGIKQTSACRIVASYRKHNRIFEKKSERLCRESNHNSHQTQKIDGNQQKSVLKSSENVQNPQMKTTVCNQIAEKVCDPKIGVLVGDERSNQLLIPGSFPMDFSLSAQSNWNSWMVNGSAMWSWPFMCHYFGERSLV